MALGPSPGRPVYWKALLLVAPLVALFCYGVHLVDDYYSFRIPTAVLIAIGIPAALLGALTVHSRVLDDWRSGWAMENIDRDRLGQ